MKNSFQEMKIQLKINLSFRQVVTRSLKGKKVGGAVKLTKGCQREKNHVKHSKFMKLKINTEFEFEWVILLSLLPYDAKKATCPEQYRTMCGINLLFWPPQKPTSCRYRTIQFRQKHVFEEKTDFSKLGNSIYFIEPQCLLNCQPLSLFFSQGGEETGSVAPRQISELE